MNSISPISTSTAVITVEPKDQTPQEDNTSLPNTTNNESAKRDLELQAAVMQKQVEKEYNNPENIDLFFDRVYIATFQRKPQDLDQLNLPGSLHQLLNDFSIVGKQQDIDIAKETLIDLKSYDYETLTPQQKITYKVLEWQLQHKIAGERFIYHDYLVTHTNGVLEEMFLTFTRFHKIENANDFENYKLRLQQVPKKLAEVKEYLMQQFKMGIKLPIFAYGKILAKLDPFITITANKHPFYTYCEQRLANLPGVHEQSSLDWLEHILNGQVIPATEDLRQCLLELSLFTNTNHGLCMLPDGKEYYAYCLQRHTTTNLSIEEIHEMGQKELMRVLKEIRALLAKHKIDNPNKSVGYLLGLFNKTKRELIEKRTSNERDFIRTFNSTLAKSQVLLKLQWQRKEVHLLRKKGDFRAYAEGWELFSETISDERGIYKHLLDKLDFLQFQLLSALKLVVDVGIHAYGWPIEYAIDFIHKKTGFDRKAIIEEVENCFVNPGQGCSSLIGHLKILEWREKAKASLGEKFLFPTFCRVILDTGGVPLEVLDGIMKELY